MITKGRVKVSRAIANPIAFAKGLLWGSGGGSSELADSIGGKRKVSVV